MSQQSFQTVQDAAVTAVQHAEVHLLYRYNNTRERMSHRQIMAVSLNMSSQHPSGLEVLTCCTLAVVIALSMVLRKNRHFPSKGWNGRKRLGLVSFESGALGSGTVIKEPFHLTLLVFSLLLYNVSQRSVYSAPVSRRGREERTVILGE